MYIYGHRLRTIRNNIKPEMTSALRYKNVKYEIKSTKNYNRQCQQDDNVSVRTNLEKQWSPVEVIDHTNKYSHKVGTNDGGERRRQAGHIRERNDN